MPAAIGMPRCVGGRDRDAQHGEHLAAALDEPRVGVLPARLGEVDDRRQRRDQERPAGAHEVERGRRGERPVLDGAHAGEHRVANALVAVAVAHHAAAQAPRRVDHGADLALVVDLHARVLLGQAGALGRARLDVVDAARDVDLHDEAPGRPGRGRRRAARPAARAAGRRAGCRRGWASRTGRRRACAAPPRPPCSPSARRPTS